MDNRGEIVIYQNGEGPDFRIEVRVEGDTVWLTQSQMVELFRSTKQNVSLHINNIYREGELDRNATVKEYLTVQSEGGRRINRMMLYYNLDVIISVGYRVKSLRGTQFRIWANRILKEYMLKGWVLNQCLDKIENKIVEHDQKFEMLIKRNQIPEEGIFYDGQIFDAYQFVSDLIKSAAQSVVLIDNYVDESVLTLLSKRQSAVTATIYTSSVSKQLKLDLKRFNSQYPTVEVKIFTKSHDRFLIIDNMTVYHIGASLKDLGKKWFAFSKIELNALEIIQKLQ